jgi:hypothetical protein
MDDSAPAPSGFEIDVGAHAMCKASIASLFLSLALVMSCASSEAGSVPVIGPPEDLVRLAGEWVGTYDSPGTGRSGSITFHLTENPEGAHGDVLMVPKKDYVRDETQRSYPRSMASHASVLSIEFVRITAGEISGKIAPYSDPGIPDATLETHFSGRIEGDWIEGTFVTYSDHGVSPLRGTWRAHRTAAK